MDEPCTQVLVNNCQFTVESNDNDDTEDQSEQLVWIVHGVILYQMHNKGTHADATILSSTTKELISLVLRSTTLAKLYSFNSWYFLVCFFYI